MNILSNIVNEEAKVEMCPEACCGKPVTECACGPDCEHCDCHEKNKMNEAGGYYTQPVYDMIEQHGIEKVMHELLTALDGDVIQDALSRMNTENESYSPGDENEDGMVSNCCGAPIMDVYDGHGRCSDCKEMASAEREEEYYESKVMQAREQIAQEESPVIEADDELQRIQDLVKFR
jgi:hypothetical protein